MMKAHKQIDKIDALALAGAPKTGSASARTATIQEKYARRYVQILEAAAEEFSDKGYHVATTKGIAERAGIQQGSIYYYIKSKEAALEQICVVAIQGYVAFSEEIKRSRREPTQKVRELIFNHLVTIEDRPAFFRVFMTHRHDLGDESRHDIGRQIRLYERNVEAIIRQGKNKGIFRGDIDCVYASLALLGMCNSVAVWWGKRSSATISQIVQQYGDIFVQGMVSEPRLLNQYSRMTVGT